MKLYPDVWMDANLLINTDEWMDGRMDRWMDGYVNGWLEGVNMLMAG